MRARLADRRLAASLVVVALAGTLASCGAPASDKVGAQARRPVARKPAMCRAAELSGHGGREGENTGAHADVVIINTSSRACQLRGVPAVALMTTSAVVLSIRAEPPASGASHLFVLQPGRRHAARLMLYWFNWCGRPPGPLWLRVTLPASAGTFVVPFNGPPDYGYVPACVARGQPSTISVLSAYTAR